MNKELEKEAEKYINSKQKPLTKYDLAAFAERHIEELEQKLEQIKNEKFEKALSQIKHDREVVIEYNERLQKENTELKDCFKIAKDNEYEYQSLFTKAKEIMKRLVDLSNSSRSLLGGTWHETVREAEDFLNEVEK